MPIQRGAPNSSTAIQKAWNAARGTPIYIPAGQYRLDSTITAPFNDGAGIIGDGPDVTVLRGTFTNGDLIKSLDVTYPVFVGFTATRTEMASTGYGLNMNADLAHVPLTNDKAIVRDLHLSKHAVGINLGNTGYSIAENVISEFNSGSGFNLCGQWQTKNLFAALNGGNGFSVLSNTGSPQSCGQWQGLSTSGNSGFGFAVFGGSFSSRIPGLRMMDCFFGQDKAGEMFLDTYGDAPHTFTNLYCEGTPGITTGGITITGNNPSCFFSGCVSTTGGSGIALVCNADLTPGSAYPTMISIVGGLYDTSHLAANDAIRINAGRATIMSAQARACAGAAGIRAICTAVSIVGCFATSIVTTGSETVFNQGNY